MCVYVLGAERNKLWCMLFWDIVRVFLYMWNDTLFYYSYYIFRIFLYFTVLNLRMAKVWCRNVIMNFNYRIQALCIFMSRIIYKRLDANHKLIFRKFEKEIKVRTKLSADIYEILSYNNYYNNWHFTWSNGTIELRNMCNEIFSLYQLY